MALIAISGYSGSGKDTVGHIIQLLVANENLQPGYRFSIPDGLNEPSHLEYYSGWSIRKWAGKLKQLAYLLTGIPLENFEDQEFKKTYLSEQWNYWTISVKDAGKLLFQHGRYMSKQQAELFVPFLREQYGEFDMEYVVEMQQITVRQFLQELGTDSLRKSLHPNVWVNALMVDYKKDKANNVYKIRQGKAARMSGEYPNWIITDTRFENEADTIRNKGGILIRVNRPGVDPVNEHESEIGLDGYDFDYVINNDSDLHDLVEKTKDILIQANILKPESVQV